MTEELLRMCRGDTSRFLLVPGINLIELASNTTSQWTLNCLSKCDSGKIRYCVACNKHSPIEALERLSKDKANGVWWGARRTLEYLQGKLEQIEDEGCG